MSKTGKICSFRRKRPFQKVFDLWSLYHSFLENLTSERQLLWGVAQILSTSGDFTDKGRS